MAFGRTVYVDIGQPGEDGRRFEALTMSGHVEKHISGEPNTARIDIVNPSKRSIAAAQEEGAMIRIFAGHDVPRLIFQGDINRGGAEEEHDDTERLLKIEAQDGGRQLSDAHVEASFSSEMTPEQVFGVVAESMGLPLGTVQIDGDDRWPRGVCISSPARVAMDQMTAIVGADWSVQDGALQVVDTLGHTEEEVVVVSSRRRNLIGRPTLQDVGIQFTALLDGRIRPGRRVVLESKEHYGVYVAQEVRHAINSRLDDTYYTIVTGVEA